MIIGVCCLQARSGEHPRYSSCCGLHTIYPSNYSQEEADFDSIALVGHEAESDFHSLQQMDAKTTDVLEELKLKYGEGRITQGVFEGDNAMVFCRSMPTIDFLKVARSLL